MVIALLAVALAAPQPCVTTTTPNARTVIDRALVETGLARADGRALHFDGFDVTAHAFESDRPSDPPFLAAVASLDAWLDPRTGVERTSSQATLGGTEPPMLVIGNATASFDRRDTSLVASATTHGALYLTRPLDVWAVLLDWRASSDAHTVATCDYRDYPRLVLSRRGARGEERLFIDPKSGLPSKLDREEPDYLWGNVHAEYVYSTWQKDGGVRWPVSSFRVVDGATETTRTFGNVRLAPTDSAPSLTLPMTEAPMPLEPPRFMIPTNPDTVRVGAQTFLLHNTGFNEAVTLARDTVFLFDATQGETRAREDSAWIGRLFPGKHPIVIIVTDIAWPHVAGVRFWIATGATIVTHEANRAFLQHVIDRRWTQTPDFLEKRRGRVTPRLRTVKDSLRLAHGDITLFAIDGVGSEGALAGFSAPDRFLWASDYVQTLSGPTEYLDEVWTAVERMHLAPQRVAAEHLRLSSWDTATRVHSGSE